MLQYLLQTVNPSNNFKVKLEDLFESYPDVDKFALGFPEEWKNEKLWSNKN